MDFRLVKPVRCITHKFIICPWHHDRHLLCAVVAAVVTTALGRDLNCLTIVIAKNQISFDFSPHDS